jgi:hypothetical protein
VFAILPGVATIRSLDTARTDAVHLEKDSSSVGMTKWRRRAMAARHYIRQPYPERHDTQKWHSADHC